MDAGGKRCLPMWMLKRSVPEALPVSETGESQLPFQGQARIQASLQEMKATALEGGEEFPRQEAKKLNENPDSLFQSQTRKRSGKSRRLYMNHRTTSCSKSGSGRKRALERNAAYNPSVMRERSHFEELNQTINEFGPENDVDLEALSPTKSEVDVGLTIEDLVSIAEEYVNADKEKQHWQKANEESKSVAHKSSSSVYSKGTLCGSAQSNLQISECVTTTHSFHSSAADVTESTPLGISRTGNVAQDMLDVFLGPWLRIPSEERKLERTQKKT